MFRKFLKLIVKLRLNAKAHSCNPSYLGGRLGGLQPEPKKPSKSSSSQLTNHEDAYL
jgi:hypothetical protein